ncbi:MAG: hypothetical protein AAGC93_21290 [Cyanobacteria bacterium P01_F01_bin.53]
MPAPNKTVLEPAENADWGAFQVGMLSNQAYQRVSNLSLDPLAVTRLETFFSVQGEQLAVAVQLWALMLKDMPGEVLPTPTEVAGWNAIARATHMPIQFNDQGLLEAL